MAMLLQELLGSMNILWGSFWKLGRDIQQISARALMQFPELFVLLRDPKESPLPELDEYYSTSDARRLGNGSFGTVLVMQSRKAAETEDCIEHAIKAVSLTRLQSGADEEALRCEISTLMELHHENIVRVIGLYRYDTQLPDETCGEPPYLCIAMPRIDGQPLTAMLRASPEAPPVCCTGGAGFQLAHALAPQLFAALAYMHKQGICHRDIWPDNLLVDGTSSVTIIDFGCASYYGDDVLKTDSGARQLNLNYASPEVYETHAVQLQNWPGSPQQDCWAVGLVLAEVIEGCVISGYLGNALPVQDGSYLHQLLAEHLEHLQQGYGILLEPDAEKRMTMEEAESGWMADGTCFTQPVVDPDLACEKAVDTPDKQRAAVLRRSDHDRSCHSPVSGSPTMLLRNSDFEPGTLVWYRPRSAEYSSYEFPGMIVADDRSLGRWIVQLYDYSGRPLPEKHVSYNDKQRMQIRDTHLDYELKSKSPVSAALSSLRVDGSTSQQATESSGLPSSSRESDDCACFVEGCPIWYKSEIDNEFCSGFVIKNDKARGHSVIRLQNYKGAAAEIIVCHGDCGRLLPRSVQNRESAEQIHSARQKFFEGPATGHHLASPGQDAGRLEGRSSMPNVQVDSTLIEHAGRDWDPKRPQTCTISPTIVFPPPEIASQQASNTAMSPTVVAPQKAPVRCSKAQLVLSPQRSKTPTKSQFSPPIMSPRSTAPKQVVAGTHRHQNSGRTSMSTKGCVTPRQLEVVKSPISHSVEVPIHGGVETSTLHRPRTLTPPRVATGLHRPSKTPPRARACTLSEIHATPHDSTPRSRTTNSSLVASSFPSPLVLESSVVGQPTVRTSSTPAASALLVMPSWSSAPAARSLAFGSPSRLQGSLSPQGRSSPLRTVSPPAAPLRACLDASIPLSSLDTSPCSVTPRQRQVESGRRGPEHRAPHDKMSARRAVSPRTKHFWPPWSAAVSPQSPATLNKSWQAGEVSPLSGRGEPTVLRRHA